MARWKGDPLKDPAYIAAKNRIAEGQQRRPQGQPQSAEGIRQAKKLVAETQKNAGKQAADLPRWKEAEAKKLRRQAMLRVDQKLMRRIDELLTAGDLEAAKKIINKGKANAAKANADKVCTSCKGTGKKRSWGKEAPCNACKGTGQHQWYQF